MLEVILIIVSVLVVDFAGIYINRSIIRNVDMNTESYMFNIHHTGFSIFFRFVMCCSIAAFSYYFITDYGLVDRRSITSIVLFLIGFIELIKQLFFKIEVSGNSISLKSLTKRAHFTFDEITKVEITRIFSFVFVDVYANDDQIFTLRSELAGQSLFINRLKDQGIEWRNILGEPLDKSDF